jgi:hypothetical protein
MSSFLFSLSLSLSLLFCLFFLFFHKNTLSLSSSRSRHRSWLFLAKQFHQTRKKFISFSLIRLPHFAPSNEIIDRYKNKNQKKVSERERKSLVLRRRTFEHTHNNGRVAAIRRKDYLLWHEEI